ncbi:unnamed protein product [Peniophora sp. CBMAI 1063]|nr:unnamed protein product [Peniophora sp. CBMAI 1063]
MNHILHPELELLSDDGLHAADTVGLHALRTAPIVTGDALQDIGLETLPQRAVYGELLEQHADGFPLHAQVPQLYINTNAPFSALVCGVQGSGKSHSTSVLLESCLIRDKRLGTLPAPLSALVFHFDTAAGGSLVQPCEAAYLAALHPTRGRDARAPPVKVLVMPNSLPTMRRVYAGLPGVTVEALRFSSTDINGPRLLSMMKLEDGAQMPLYMESLMNLLRSMESNFDYARFRRELDAQDFSPGQRSMLNLRLALLDSCLTGGSPQNSVSSQFLDGQLTIIDLSSPFMDPMSACGLFDIILGLYMEADCTSGKLVVLDEAHKYLSESSSRLTESLLTVIRQQRHLATRVVISTQEPTVVPEKLLDLCSFIIAHRFTSPLWLKALTQHVATDQSELKELASKIVALRTGQAILFTPSGIARRSKTHGDVAPFGSGYMLVKSRHRVTRDGGHSLLAMSETAEVNGDARVRTASTLARDVMPAPYLDGRSHSLASPPQVDVTVPRVTGLQTPSSTCSAAETPYDSTADKADDSDGRLISHLVDYLAKQAKAGSTTVGFDKARKFMIQKHGLGGSGASKRLNDLFVKADRLGRARIEYSGGSKLLSLA